jgi:hypothetical protein
MSERERLRALVDDLPEKEVHAALRFLEFLLSLAPPEPEAEDSRHGRILSHEGMHRRVFGKD